MSKMLVSGTRQPGKNIHIYFGLLVENLKMLWKEGVDYFDASQEETFNLQALLSTINNFPAYGNLLVYSVKG